MNDAQYMYHRNICEDIKSYLKENYKNIPYEVIDADNLLDELWIEDSVTGNASGSYWCSNWMAENALAHNFDLAVEALNELGKPSHMSAESVDVTIRCYLLWDCINTVLQS